MKNFRGKRCKKCGIDLSTVNAIHGEEKNFLGFKYWMYWREPCHLQKFISMIHSSPLLLNKYHDIYKKSPEEVIAEFKNK